MMTKMTLLTLVVCAGAVPSTAMFSKPMLIPFLAAGVTETLGFAVVENTVTQVTVCGFKPSPCSDPEACEAPVCVEGFNAAMAKGCKPAAYKMMMISDGKEAYCVYQGGWALSDDGAQYAAAGCNADTLFKMPDQEQALFFDASTSVTDIHGAAVSGFDGMKKDNSGKFTCEGGKFTCAGGGKCECKYGGAPGPWISITNSKDAVTTGKISPGKNVSFSWTADKGYVGVNRYAGSGSIEAMTLKNEEGGQIGFSEQSGSMGTCNSIVSNWPIKGVGSCTQNKDVFAPVTGVVTINCSPA